MKWKEFEIGRRKGAALALVTLLIVGAACGGLFTTRIVDILQHPRDYDGKIVTVAGTAGGVTSIRRCAASSWKTNRLHPGADRAGGAAREEQVKVRGTVNGRCLLRRKPDRDRRSRRLSGCPSRRADLECGDEAHQQDFTTSGHEIAPSHRFGIVVFQGRVTKIRPLSLLPAQMRLCRNCPSSESGRIQSSPLQRAWLHQPAASAAGGDGKYWPQAHSWAFPPRRLQPSGGPFRHP
jgi:hypothetical protein